MQLTIILIFFYTFWTIKVLATQTTHTSVLNFPQAGNVQHLDFRYTGRQEPCTILGYFCHLVGGLTDYQCNRSSVVFELAAIILFPNIGTNCGQIAGRFGWLRTGYDEKRSFTNQIWPRIRLDPKGLVKSADFIEIWPYFRKPQLNLREKHTC